MEETFLDRLLKKGLQRPESAALTYESITETYASLRDKVRRACAKYQAKQKCLVFFFIDN